MKIKQPRDAGDLRARAVFQWPTKVKTAMGGSKSAPEINSKSICCDVQYGGGTDAPAEDAVFGRSRAVIVFRSELRATVALATTAIIDGATWQVEGLPSPIGSSMMKRGFSFIQVVQND